MECRHLSFGHVLLGRLGLAAARELARTAALIGVVLPGLALAQSGPAPTAPAALAAPATPATAATTAPASQTAPSTPAASGKINAVEAVEEVEVQPSKPGAEVFWSNEYPQLDRTTSLLLPRPVRRGALVLIVDHRTTQPIQDNTWHDWFGFDGGGLKIGLGLRLGILDNLDVGVYRLSHASDRFAVYELDARYRLLRQDRHLVDLGVRAGVTWFEQSDAEDAAGGFGQLLISRLLWHRLTLGTGLLYHSQSSNGVKSNLDPRWSMAVPLLLDVRILGWLAWNLEMTFNVAGYGTRDILDPSGNAVSRSSYPVFTSAVRFITNRHAFSLLITNNSYCSADGVVANSPRGFKQLTVGFSILREWNLW